MPSDLNEAALVSNDCEDVIDGVSDSLVSSSAMEDSPAEDDMSSKVEDSSVEVEEDTADGLQDATVCDLCAQRPCDWVTFGEAICEECNVMADEKYPPNMIRFHAYKIYTRLRHGILCKFDRRPLPICVRGEIMDNWPEPDHVYVGFHSALQDVASD